MNETIYFGGGCFWCTEAVFSRLKGVIEVKPGYAGGLIKDPTYEQVSSSTTGHAEVIKVIFDPQQISLSDLLTVFFSTHDPTSSNQQGNDIGTQYRSLILTTTTDQQTKTRKFLKSIPGAVTEIKSFEVFYPAETYHDRYYDRHSDAPYCQIVISPKLHKLRDKFSSLLKV